jgi:hypothetical protein
MKDLRVVTLCKGDDLFLFYRDRTELVHGTRDIILKVAILNSDPEGFRSGHFPVSSLKEEQAATKAAPASTGFW